jgi:hypothetical protein
LEPSKEDNDILFDGLSFGIGDDWPGGPVKPGCYRGFKSGRMVDLFATAKDATVLTKGLGYGGKTGWTYDCKTR